MSSGAGAGELTGRCEPLLRCGPALAGELTRRQLTPVRYRRAGVEQGLPDPGARYWVTFTAGLALASLGGVLLPARWHLLILYAPVAVGATWLSAVDLDVRRLPDNVALPLLGWTAVGVPVVAMMTPNVSSPAGLAGAVGLGGSCGSSTLPPLASSASETLKPEL